MATIVFSADSTSLILNGFGITDFGEGDYLTMTPVNDFTSHVNGVDGSVNINSRNDGRVYDLVVRVQKMSASDVYLNSQANQADPVVFNGSIKEDFTRDGVAGVESYLLENASISKLPTNTKNNTDGNALMEYTLRVRNATRNL